MSLQNPTRLRIGMHGDFAGKDFHIIGRVVMGVEVDGEAYYWNEFNLQTAAGEAATLVYEETEGGGEWRLFTMFEPEYPMTASDAATKRVGDDLNLNGADVRVTLVDSSRVYRIEGRAPEGVEVGDVAHYFNAEAGDMMQVVSWTGEELEYYNGFTLSRGAVETAFNLTREKPAKNFSSLDNSSAWTDSDSESFTSNGSFSLIAYAVIGIILFFFIGRHLSYSTSHEAAPVKKKYASAPPLTVGATGKWDEKNFRITAHAAMEICTVGAIYERNEYELTDDGGNVMVLVCGDKPGAKKWTLFLPRSPLDPPTAQKSAVQKIGDVVNIDGVVATILELFQSTVSQMENVGPDGWHTGDVYYDYTAQSEFASLLVRWNKNGIWFYRGSAIAPKDFITAFSGPNTK